jgi:glycine/D-amino acid oxidase-like deaminating enzyme
MTMTRPDLLASLADAEPRPFWLDDPDAPEAVETLVGATTADLVVVGGGYSGLWTALLAKEADPSRDVVVLESETLGWAASGRNGGFVAASLTHGIGNGVARWPDEMGALERLGRANLDGLVATVERYGIDCALERTGELTFATQPWQVDDLRESVDLLRSYGWDAEWLDAEQARAQVASPTYLGGAWNRDGVVLVNPARLVWGLARACESLGVRVYEHSRATALEREGDAMVVRTGFGAVRAPKVALCTNGFPPLLRRLRSFVVPVYDYALMTEPLTAQQRESIGWSRRQGLADAANQFHYYRLSQDNRILWGGYDAVYHFRNAVSGELDQRPETFTTLVGNFFDTFPQLEGLRFSHRWGGVIDTCSRFSQFWGAAFDGRVAYVVGYTGLGVGATRFGGQVVLDLLDGPRTPEASERLSLAMVRSKPLPFPPEPLRYGVIEVTRRSIASADARGGRRNLWLRTLDRFGLGFDS